MKWSISITVLLVDIHTEANKLFDRLRKVMQTCFMEKIVSLLCNTFGLGTSLQQSGHSLCATTVNRKLQRRHIIKIHNIRVGIFA